MKNILKGLMFEIGLIAFSIPSFAQQATAIATNEATSVLHEAVASGVKDNGAQVSVEACWANWLKAQGNLRDGKNDRNGHLLIVSHQQEALNASPGAHNWLGARKKAFETAELNARAALADTMKTEIRSSRSIAQQVLGGDDAAPSLEPTVKALSIEDKANVLVDKALDNEIAKYDPSWSKDQSPEKKKEAIATLQARYQANIAAHSELFAAGAFTVAQCEGASKDDNGKYSVLVGMIWSPKLATVAEAIWNPSLKLPPETSQPPLQDQFASFDGENPDWLAYTMGARVFTNEKGERVVVGFGAAPQTSMMSVDKRRASLDALAAIQHFVGEKVEANAETSDSFEQRDFNNGETKAFDTSAFNNKVVARSQDLQLKGTAEILSWRGSHPWSHTQMQVVAIAWTPSWSADSEQAAAMMQSIERRMNQQGAVPATKTNAKNRFKGNGAAAPTRAGAGSSTHDF